MFVVPFLKRMQVRQDHLGDLPNCAVSTQNHTLKNSKGLNADLSRAPCFKAGVANGDGLEGARHE